ncbi:Predicted sugar kinase [Raoultella ornithinolytica]|nr:Predicted sugar kinase [Raoultella ornithinolytica]
MEANYFAFRYGYHRCANGTTVQGIALLHHAQHVASRHIVRLNHGDGLVHVRIQRHVGIGNHFHTEFAYDIQHRLQRQLNTFNHGSHVRIGFIGHFQRAVQAVDNRQQFVNELLQSKFVRFFHVQLGTTTQVFHFRFYAQDTIAFTSLSFSQLRFQIRNFFIARIHLLSRNFRLNRLNVLVLFRDNFFRGLPVRRFLFFTTHEFLRVFFAFISLTSLIMGIRFRVSREAVRLSSFI